MPTVARFEGIKIQFYAKEHPQPHFHAVFAEHRAQIDIATFAVMKGTLPPAKLAAVVAWARPRQHMLMRTWETVVAHKRPEKIS
jgi:hypothetical protein